MARVRDNIRKAGIIGRLVANDFSGALVSAIVLDQDAQGDAGRSDPVAHELERRCARASPATRIDVHMIGFAKVMGDIADGAASVVLFAVITLVLTLLAVRLYCQSWRVAFVPVLCSVIAVIWQLGALVLLRYGIDPIGLLVPFLVFAIGVSHGVQKISAVSDAAFAGLGSMEAARRTFRQLLAPAVIALLADLVGFVTILMIPVQVIREMAITASIGVGDRDPHRSGAAAGAGVLRALRCRLSRARRAAPARARGAVAALWPGITERGPALAIIVVAALLAALGWWKGRETPIGDTQAGVPELRPDSRYNRDNDVITSQVQHRRRRADRDRRVAAAGVRQPRPDERRRPLRLAHAQRRRRAGRHHAAVHRQGGDRRLERGEPQVAQHPARADPAHAVDALHRDQHRAAQ